MYQSLRAHHEIFILTLSSSSQPNAGDLFDLFRGTDGKSEA